MSKQLGQFLQEQQEPFTLQIYLLERGQFRNKHLISDGDFRCCSTNSTTYRFLKRSASCSAKKRRKIIPNCSKIVKSVLNKLVTFSHNQKIKNLTNDQEHNNSTSNNTNIIADDEKISSASSTTVFNSCYDSSGAEEADISSSPHAADDNFLHEKQVSEDKRKLRLEFLEESKQLSPVSVLEETESSDDDDSPHVKKQECVKAKKQEEFSSPSVSNSGETSSESQYIKNKKAIQLSRQLLFECVKEVVENQKGKEEQFQRILGAEQLWELLLQNIWLWSQEAINETNIKQLMISDMLTSFEELSSGVEEKREIGKVVSDLIFVDISNDIVLDMLNYYSSR